MVSKLIKTALLSFGIFMFCSAVNAQSVDILTFTTDFEFSVSGKVMPAGKYYLKRSGNLLQSHIYQLLDEEKSFKASVPTMPYQFHHLAEGGKVRVTFKRSDGVLNLASIADQPVVLSQKLKT